MTRKNEIFYCVKALKKQIKEKSEDIQTEICFEELEKLCKQMIELNKDLLKYIDEYNSI